MPPRGAGRALAAVVSQAVTAGTSLILQIIAAHSLGLRGYGAFAVLLSVLVGATALYTGYVGDGLTVLDRHDPRVRRGLVTSALALLIAMGVAAAGVVRLFDLGGITLGAIFCVLSVMWLVEETGRRVLMARLEFVALVVNDVVYGIVTLAWIVGAVVIGDRVTLPTILIAMVVGACAAVATALWQLPRHELRLARPGRTGMADVAQFSAWRALQAALRPLQLLAMRLFVSLFLSLSAVGLVETGRLVVAPIQTVINGAGGYLLPASTQAERSAAAPRRRLAERAVLVLVALTVVAGGAAAALGGPLGRLLTGRPVDAVLVLGWSAYLVTWAMSLPFVLELVARKRSRDVFVIRLVDTVVGLGAMVIALGAGVDPIWVPWLLSAGGLLGAVLTRQHAVRTRPSGDGAEGLQQPAAQPLLGGADDS